MIFLDVQKMIHINKHLRTTTIILIMLVNNGIIPATNGLTTMHLEYYPDNCDLIFLLFLMMISIIFMAVLYAIIYKLISTALPSDY
jgi:hypothetical protein